jgi:hypothetical protein
MEANDLKKYDYIPMQLRASCGCSFEHGVDIYIWKANVKKEENDALRINLAEEGEEINIEDIDYILKQYWLENTPDWTGVKACLISSDAPSYSAKHEINGRAWIKNPPFAKQKNGVVLENGQPVAIQYSSSHIGDVLTFFQNNPDEKEMVFNGFTVFIQGFYELIQKKVKEKPKTKYVVLKNSDVFQSTITAQGEEE